MTTKQLNRRALISIAVGAFLCLTTPAFPQSFDHNYTSWDTLLKKHVKWLPDNKQSRTNYKDFAADRTI